MAGGALAQSIQVPNGMVNLAQGKATAQSSTYNDPATGPAASGRAVDGNPNGNFQARSIAHTNEGSPQWWKVNLGGEKTINLIRIYNRTDCCIERLAVAGALIQIKDAAGAKKWEMPLPGGPAPVYEIPVPGMKGTEVWIQNRGPQFLNIAEVAVFGPPQP